MAENRTEYAVKGTVGKHGRWQVTTETVPGHENDREWTQRIVDEQREAQAHAGLTPDAVLVIRTVTATDWSA